MGKHRWIAPVVFGLLLLILWAVLTQTNVVAEYLLPSPQAVFDSFFGGFSNGHLASSLWQTLREALLGCLAAAVCGVPLGLAIAHFDILSRTIEPYLAASQAIPAVAVAPLLVSWIGYGSAPIITLCAVMVIFPIIINTAVGVRSLDPDLIGAARLDGCSGWTLLLRIELPLAAPYIMAGLRTGFTLAMTGAVVGEMVIGGQRGLGIELVTAQHLNDTPAMFATIFLLSIVAVGLYLTLRTAETRIVRAVSER
ncbi:ABC transporter permease [Arcanobacterium bovis]|uniref:ABC transporter permease n=2 Tax=Arcanobacterium bovis TaxID=2529275 RepID=A0A4Q9V1Q4_9ACTO|nr:ABC transporter permease [Arcanobacterium bovis]